MKRTEATDTGQKLSIAMADVRHLRCGAPLYKERLLAYACCGICFNLTGAFKEGVFLWIQINSNNIKNSVIIFFYTFYCILTLLTQLYVEL